MMEKREKKPVHKVLSNLVKKGMLLCEWKGRWATYTINAGYKKRVEQVDFSDIEVPKIDLKNETDRIIYI